VGGGSVFFGLEIAESYINDISEDLILLYAYIKNKDPMFMQRLIALNEAWKNLSVTNWESVDFGFAAHSVSLKEIFKGYKESEERRRLSKAKKYAERGQTFDTTQVEITSLKAAFYCTIRYVYNRERQSQDPDIMTRVLAYYYLREFSYSSMFRFSSSGSFNVPYGGMSYNAKNFDTKIELIKSYDIEGVRIYREDCIVFLNRFEFEETDFIFVDPPYDSEFSDYDDNIFNKEAQIRLAEKLSVLPAKIMIVIKNTDFIYNLYKEKGFHIKSFDKRYSVNFQNRNIREVKHLLITNY
jgi:DNA adenine methylase